MSLLTEMKQFVGRLRAGTATEDELDQALPLVKALEENPAALAEEIRKERKRKPAAAPAPDDEEEESEEEEEPEPEPEPEEEDESEEEEEEAPPRKVRKSVSTPDVDADDLHETLLKAAGGNELIFDAVPYLKAVADHLEGLTKGLGTLRRDVAKLQKAVAARPAAAEPAADSPEDAAARRVMKGLADKMDVLVGQLEEMSETAAGRPSSPHPRRLLRKAESPALRRLTKGVVLDRLQKAYLDGKIDGAAFDDACWAVDHPADSEMTPEMVLENCLQE